MKKIITTLLCLALLSMTLFFGCAQNSTETEKPPEGYVIDAQVLRRIEPDDFGIPLYILYEYQVSIYGYLEHESTYDINIQVAFYSNDEYIKTVTLNYTYRGNEKTSVRKQTPISVDLCSNKEKITAKVVKATWK